MKLITTLLALAWSSVWLCSAVWAQGNTSRTYTGINGPQGGKRPDTSYGSLPVPDKFVVNVYGQGDEFAIEVMSPGGDICGRPFYFTGTMIFQSNQSTGSIGGPMLRCTNPDLVVSCNHKPIYEVGYTGTVERSAGTYLIKITYPDQKWLKEDCQKKREDVGKETILLTYQPPTPPEPDLKEKIKRTETKYVDGVVDQIEGGKMFQHPRR